MAALLFFALFSDSPLSAASCLLVIQARINVDVSRRRPSFGLIRTITGRLRSLYPAVSHNRLEYSHLGLVR